MAKAAVYLASWDTEFVTGTSFVIDGGSRVAGFHILWDAQRGRFRCQQQVANAIVLGSPLTPLTGFDLALEEVVYEHNGEFVGSYTAAEVLDNPLNALA